MADPNIKIKRSSVEGKIPTADQLPLGEIALNTFDGKLFASKNVGIGTTVFTVNPWTVGTGTNTYNTYFTAGNVGIGTTNPTELGLTVSGKIQINQDGGSNNRLIFRGQPGSSYRWNIDNYGSSNEFRIFREDDATSANEISYLGISTTGTVTATKFSGDGSLLTGITAAGSGVVVENQGSNVGTAGTLNFSTNLSASFSSGTATISLSNNPSISGILTADQVHATNNGNGTNVKIGDDLWIGDINLANTIRFSGAQDSAKAFVVFGTSDAVALGRTGTGPLYYGGDFNVAGIVTASSFSGNASSATYATTAGVATVAQGLTGTPNITVGIVTATSFVKSGGTSSEFLKADGSVDSSTYLTSYTETDTLNSVTGRGNSTANGISVGILTATSGNFSGIVTSSSAVISGVVTATSFSGSGTNLTGIVTSITAGSGISVDQSTGNVTITSTGGGGGESYWVSTSVGIHTLSNVGIGTTNPTSKLSVVGDGNFTGVVTATSFVKSGGTSSEFLKADGSVDTNTYLTTTGSGTNLTGIVTSIVAGDNITISGSTGQVTINSTATGGGATATLDILEVMLFA